MYEDQGLTYDYENGEFSQIPITWDDAASTLTIGERDGFFPEMEDHTFEIVLVSPDSPVGFSFEPTSMETVNYDGEEVQTAL